MAEIILEPTALSKVIPLKFKINDVDVPKTTQLSTNKQFNTTDTDAWFTFELDGLASTSGTYDLTLINLDDKSIFHHADVIFAALPFHYKLNSSEDVTLNEIRHAGRWLGQLVVTLSNGDTTARQFGFNIAGHILDGQDAQVILLSDYQALINTINLAKDDLAQYNVDYAALLVDIAAAEDARVTAYNQLLADQQANIEAFDVALDEGIVAANLATKLQDFETTNNSRLLSAEQQLEQTLNKSAITLTHMFADNTARDAYFVANPSELMEQLFIKVGTGYQQYLGSIWQASSAIVAEQVSASNQPITDTGNYFTTDNTNAALQELGAHKASNSNPHGVTKAQVGLSNVDNTSDANKPVSTAGQAALNLKADKTQEAWITASLLNGWSGTFRYRKNSIGQVEYQGVITSGTATAGTKILDFPTGYRTGLGMHITMAFDGSGGGIFGIRMRDNGEVVATSGFTNGRTYHISGVFATA